MPEPTRGPFTLDVDPADALPLIVHHDGREMFRITPEYVFEWGDGVTVDEMARTLATAVTAILNQSWKAPDA